MTKLSIGARVTVIDEESRFWGWDGNIEEIHNPGSVSVRLDQDIAGSEIFDTKQIQIIDPETAP